MFVLLEVELILLLLLFVFEEGVDANELLVLWSFVNGGGRDGGANDGGGIEPGIGLAGIANGENVSIIFIIIIIIIKWEYKKKTTIEKKIC